MDRVAARFFPRLAAGQRVESCALGTHRSAFLLHGPEGFTIVVGDTTQAHVLVVGHDLWSGHDAILKSLGRPTAVTIRDNSLAIAYADGRILAGHLTKDPSHGFVGLTPHADNPVTVPAGCMDWVDASELAVAGIPDLGHGDIASVRLQTKGNPVSKSFCALTHPPTALRTDLSSGGSSRLACLDAGRNVQIFNRLDDTWTLTHMVVGSEVLYGISKTLLLTQEVDDDQTAVVAHRFDGLDWPRKVLVVSNATAACIHGPDVVVLEKPTSDRTLPHLVRYRNAELGAATRPCQIGGLANLNTHYVMASNIAGHCVVATPSTAQVWAVRS